MIKKHKGILFASFLIGLAVFPLLSREKQKEFPSDCVFFHLSSQGRSEIRKMLKELDLAVQTAANDITAEKILMLQALAQKDMDRTAADFYQAGIAEKTAALQARVDKIFLDTLERMPLIDRQSYMDFYLKNRQRIKEDSLISPVAASFGLTGMDETSVDNK